MNAIRCLVFVFLLLPVLAAGCHHHDGTGSTDKIYDVKGKVVSVNKEKNTIKLDHDDIPGLMKAMSMDFKVEDAKLLDGLNAGDQVQGRFKEKDGDCILLELKKP